MKAWLKLSRVINDAARAHPRAFRSAIITLGVAAVLAIVSGAWWTCVIVTSLPDKNAIRSIGTMAQATTLLDASDRQAERLIGQLRLSAANAAEQAHTLNGASRAVGAFAVADAAETLERQLRRGGDTSAAIAALDHAVTEARAAKPARRLPK